MFDRQRVHLIPGNHDVNSAGTDLAMFKTQLMHYRNVFGVDYHPFKTQHATFAMINSETLIAPHLGLNGTTDPWVLNQTETQWDWLEATLKTASTASSHSIVVTHHPPTEKDVYWNWPLVARKRLLSLLAKYHVKHVLCGHTHTTTNRTVDGPNIYTVAGTARAFDQRGCGYRVLHINATSITTEYVRQDDPSLKQCEPTLVHPDFEDNPNLSKTWADVNWLLD